MTQDEQMDRLERSLRLCLKTQVRESSEPRMTAAQLGAYAKALEERDDAKKALAENPGDSEAEKTLRIAQKVLDQARDELKR